MRALLTSLWRRRLVDRFSVPAILCDDDGRIRQANPSATALLRHHRLSERQLPSDAWRADGEDLTSVLKATNGLRFTRHALTDQTWLVLPQDGDDPVFSGRLYRSAHELLSRVIATVAHDLRSPLASLFFNLGVLRSRWTALNAEQVESTLDAMTRACELEMKTIAALVERIGTDSQESLTLGQRMDRIAERLTPLFRGGTNTLGIQVDRDVQVFGGSMLFEQIFVNLIGNAVETRPEPVHVEVRTYGAVDEGRQLAVRVANDGPGVDEQQRVRIFQPFFTTKPTGTGMGLTFAREAARQLGGDLMLLPGTPTVFEVRLPLKEAR